MGRVEKTVFISYRRTSAPWALLIFHNLTQHGYDVFIDYSGIGSGDFESAIFENIQARAHFLVLLTPSTLERCGDPNDLLRREIETAFETRRNVVPLMLDGFDFSSPTVATQLTGGLSALKGYNGLHVPPDYFPDAMDRLREKFLNVPLDAVLHPASSRAQKVAREEQAAAQTAAVEQGLERGSGAQIEGELGEAPQNQKEPQPNRSGGIVESRSAGTKFLSWATTLWARIVLTSCAVLIGVIIFRLWVIRQPTSGGGSGTTPQQTTPQQQMGNETSGGTARVTGVNLHGRVFGVSGQSVVHVSAIVGKVFPPPKEHPVIDQKGLMFSPHIVVVQQGTTVDFLNSDNVAHNVFWIAVGSDRTAGHNLGTWPKGEKRSFTFEKAGVVTLLCNVHPEMSGFIVVSPTPYYAITDKSGAFKIENVPEGDYTLTAWHEGGNSQSLRIFVSEDTEVNFTLRRL